MTFGEYIKQKRAENHLTQHMLSKLSGVSHLSITRLETGKSNAPKEKTVRKLADTMGWDYDEMMAFLRPSAEMLAPEKRTLSKGEIKTPEKKAKDSVPAKKVPEPATLGEYIRKLRAEKGISIREMRSKSRLELDTLMKIEDDQKKLVLEKELRAIAKALDGDLGIMYRLAGYPEDKAEIVRKEQEEQAASQMLWEMKDRDTEFVELMYQAAMKLGKKEREALKTILRGMLN